MGRPRRGWLLVAGAVLGSGVAFLDTAVVNIAIPSIGTYFGVGFSTLQWIIGAYLLTVSSFLLLGGMLGDVLGRRAVFLAGVTLFAAGSTICAASPGIATLLAGRAVQGLGGALVLPVSLPLVTAAFGEEERYRVIAAWTALVGIGAIAGPFAGGALIDWTGWRAVFLLNLPFAAASLILVVRNADPARPPESERHVDVLGAATAVLALGGLTYMLIEGPAIGWSHPATVTAGVVGLAAAVVFPLVERRARRPLLPRELLGNPAFRQVNLVTVGVYAAFNVVLFVSPMYLQSARGFTAFGSAVLLLPIELLLLVLSPLMGRLARRFGPWRLLAFGPVVSAAGLALVASHAADGAVLPGLLVFALGFAITVVPLNSALFDGLAADNSGVGFGVNNAVARLSGLLAIALLPLVAGDAGPLDGVFRRSVWFCALLCLAGGVVAAVRRRASPPS